MKIFVAQLLTETNTFTACPTGMASFEEYGIFHGDGSIRAPAGTGSFMAAMRESIEADGFHMVESLCAVAQPNGRTVRRVYETLRDRVLADLAAGSPVDAVVLHLHGAMAADGYDDCEGDLLAAVRSVVGAGVTIAVLIDLHCHLTALMLASADIVAAYQEYPHVDILTRARHVYRLAIDAARGRTVPTTAVFDCKMVGLWHTTREPMAGFVQSLRILEGRDGVLSVSLGHGFPWGDVPESGAKLWVTTDNDASQADILAERLGREFWQLRDSTRAQLLTIDEALDVALAHADGTTVLADVADNAGGGAPGDSTFVLQRLIERRVRDVAIGMFWDLGAIHICRAAGVGAVLELRIGGKCGPFSGAPLDVRVTVEAIVEAHAQEGLDAIEPLGPSVSLRTDDGIHIALASVRSQVFSPSAFTGLGIDLASKRIVVVKSTHHFHAGFAPLAQRILYVSTPGALRQDFEAIPYRSRSLNYWPRVADPYRFPD